MPHSLPRADVLEQFLAQVEEGVVNHNTRFSTSFSIFCPQENEIRRAGVRYLTGADSGVKDADNNMLYTKLYFVSCINCHHTSYLMLYQTDIETNMVIVERDTLQTIGVNVPDGVRYYLDQARKSYRVGAKSAAVAMYRAALEQLLYDQGFKDGMLGEKIKSLEGAIKSGTAPSWAPRLDRDYLTIIKDLGNSSIHVNGGDLSIQQRFDSNIISQIEIVFYEMIDEIYEAPARRESRKKMLLEASKPKK